MKKSIVYYSDCIFFAGCENMLANFLNSEELRNEYDVHFVYRYSKKYEEGAKNRIKDMSICEGVDLVIEPFMEDYVTSSNRLFALFQKIIWAVLFNFTKYWALFRNVRKLKRVFSKYNPDIVHINNGGYPAATSAQAAVIAAHKCHVDRIYYVVNNMAMSYFHATRVIDVFLDPFIKKYVTCFVTGSANAGSRLKSVLKLQDNKHVVIRNGINQRSTTMNVEQFKLQYKIPEDDLVFSTIANLEERKGHRYLLSAIKELHYDGKIKGVSFVLEGKGPNEEFIKNYIRDNDLGGCVNLISVPAIYDLYAASDVVILPSIANEDFPNIIIEAMGMGIPVIGTKIAGIPEQIVPSETGILIEPANVEQLKKAIIKMIDDTSFRKECGIKAKEVFDNSYTAKKSVDNYIKLYKQ